MAWVDPDVLAALRNGANLCPECLGRKVIVYTVAPDFARDSQRPLAQRCPTCTGTGLEGVKRDR